MPFSVERLDNEPIYITRYWGSIDFNDFEQAGQQLEAILDVTLPRLALIYDTDPADIDFQETLKVIRQTALNVTGAGTGQTVLLAFAGTRPMIKLFIEALRQKQFAGQNFPLFATVDDAITAMRFALAQLQE